MRILGSLILLPLIALELSCGHRGPAHAAAGAPPVTQAQVDELREQVKALQTLVPDQAAVMSHLAQHFTNLWFALEAENWPLAAFYLSETRSNLRWAVRVKPLRKTSQGQDVDVKAIAEAVDNSQLQELERAIGKKEKARAQELYRQTLIACHSCHQASEKPYLMTQVPPEPEVRVIRVPAGLAVNGTRRQKLARLLREGPRTVLDLSRALGAPVKSVLDDLEHVRRGLKEGEEWRAEDAACLGCGFVFRGRKRLDKPSRCPECRSEEIRDAAYAIGRKA